MKDSSCAFLCSMGNCRIAKVILGAREGKKQMKVLIVSDTHGHRKEIREIIEREKPIDLLIHLGDIQGDEEYIQSLAACPMEAGERKQRPGYGHSQGSGNPAGSS